MKYQIDMYGSGQLQEKDELRQMFRIYLFLHAREWNVHAQATDNAVFRQLSANLLRSCFLDVLCIQFINFCKSYVPLYFDFLTYCTVGVFNATRSYSSYISKMMLLNVGTKQDDDDDDDG
jgi:hypothetical protein